VPRREPLAADLQSLSAYVRRVQKCCERVEVQFKRKKLRTTDVELVYASGFLAAVTRWEAFLEDSLYEAVCGPAPRKLKLRRSVIIESRAKLSEVLLFPDKEYITLTTVKQAENLYGLFLENSGPFGSVGESNRSYIQQAIWIRNAIAHSSESALGKFKSKVPGVDALPRNRRAPGAFLRHEFRTSPTQRRLDLYCGAILSAASEMSEGWSAG
jgi:hypothetical protein